MIIGSSASKTQKSKATCSLEVIMTTQPLINEIQIDIRYEPTDKNTPSKQQ